MKQPDRIVNLQDPTESQMWVHQITKYLEYITFGEGVPTATPPTGNGTIYIRLDGGAGSTFYVYEGGSWAAK